MIEILKGFDPINSNYEIMHLIGSNGLIVAAFISLFGYLGFLNYAQP